MLAAMTIAAFVLLPLAALLLVALSGGFADWPHLVDNVLPVALRVTAELMLGVIVLTASMGIIPAWLTVYHDFPGRRLVAWALVLPLAVPTYLAAYAYAEFLHFTGPVQTGLRGLFGYTSSRDYWFPDVRSVWGAALVMATVLYPYVYLTVRASFLMQGRNAMDIARTLGSSATGSILRVLLPMARPAIVIGVSLALMETINDVGAVEFLGVRTLTSAVYTTWLNRGSLGGAAQLACLMLAVVLMILLTERWARRRQRFHLPRATAMVHRIAPVRLTGWRGWLALFACLMPSILGFGIPFFVLGSYAVKRLDHLLDPALHEAIITSLSVAACAALVTVALAFVLSYAMRVAPSARLMTINRIAAVGYAVPGTVLALGILIPLARFDNLINHAMQQVLGWRPGLLLTGSAACIIYAMSVRFLAMAEGAIDSGFHKIPVHLDSAARALGRNARQTLRDVLLPILRPAFLTAGLLVFIDSVKELSATILLRPFGYHSLATYVYEYASRADVEDASVAAILIMVAGIAPVVLLSRFMDSGLGREAR